MPRAQQKPQLQVGVIGTGYIGKAHVFGYATAQKVLDLPLAPVMHTVADITEELAATAADAMGFAQWTTDWRTMIDDPTIDVIHVATPNALHCEMSLAAIAAGKHVHCEKPLATSVEDARAMTAAAEAAGIKTQVGFNYLCNPMMALAKEMIASGELGDIRGYRGLHCEDYMTDAEAPPNFRHEPAGGGALADIGSHALATAEYLLGPIAEVMGHCVTTIAERPDEEGGRRTMEVDDVGRAFVVFESGATGSIEGNWMSTGRKMQHDFEVYGSKGALAFSQERFSELHYYRVDDAPGRRGFRRIEAAPDHPPYGRFCPGAGHQLGFNDLKAIEMAGFVDAMAGKGPETFNFRDGLRSQILLETIRRSSREGRWLPVKT